MLHMDIALTNRSVQIAYHYYEWPKRGIPIGRAKLAVECIVRRLVLRTKGSCGVIRKLTAADLWKPSIGEQESEASSSYQYLHHCYCRAVS